MARPPKEITKNYRVDVRMNREELDVLERCSKELNTTKSETMLIGLNLVNEMLKDAKEKTV